MCSRVERGDLVAIDERQRQLPAATLVLQHGAGQAAPSVDVDVDIGLLVGADDLDGRFGADGGTRRLVHADPLLASALRS